MLLGDSTERLRELPDASVDFSVFSPPFQSLFVYSPTERDLGNSATKEEFFAHFAYIIEELLRVTKSGRNVRWPSWPSRPTNSTTSTTRSRSTA